MQPYNGPERRRNFRLPDEEFNRLKDAAKEEIKQEFLAEIGGSSLKFILWLAGAVFTAAATWLGLNGHFSK